MLPVPDEPPQADGEVRFRDDDLDGRTVRVAYLWMPLAIIGLFLLRGVAGYLTDIGMGKAARSIARDLRVMVLDKYMRLPGQRFDAEPVPSMLVRLGLVQCNRFL